MRTLCFVLVLGISSTGCSGCAEDDPRSSGALEVPKPPSDSKRISISPAMRDLFADAGDAAATR